MGKNNEARLNSPGNNQQSKDTTHKTELQTIFQYLQKHTATGTMVSIATGIPKKNFTRYKKDLENKGILWEAEKKHCKITGHLAWYLTTDSEKVKKNVESIIPKL